jgi:arsenite/tail-anchored protein-transporting ATPase
VLLSGARPLTLFSGKGGVGKTTMAAAAALALAESGARTLVVSTDPAHSLGDLFGRPLSGEATGVLPGLAAVEVDAEAVADAHVAQVRDTVLGSVDDQLRPAVERHLDLARHSPGTLEAALLDRMAELMELCPGRYDHVVFDTAPSGHTLRLLALPALLSAWVEGLTRQRERVAGMERMLANLVGDQGGTGSDPVLARLHERRNRLRVAGERLRSDADLWLVTVPERLAIEETARAADALRQGGLHVAGVVVNRVLPADADGAFLADRREQQRGYLAEIRRRFAGHPIVEVPQQRRDVSDAGQLRTIAAGLAAITG